MASQPSTREALYQRIRESSKDEVILEEMIRLGFWPAAGDVPNDPADEIRRRGELQRQLDELREKGRRLYNEKALINEARKARMAESRRKQAETKARRERERGEKASAWAKRKSGEILYLGEGESGGLSQKTSDPSKLAHFGLPKLDTAEQLAAAMGIEIKALRFLAYNRRTSKVSHYRRFFIPKKTGGQRLISAPMRRLKTAQTWVLTNILDKVTLHEAAHGFRQGRSIVTNARPHVGSAVVLNLDLKDFFPTVTVRRIKGVFRALGYSEAVATALALVCSEPEVDEVALDGETYYVARGPRHLPQGSPASPGITNLLCRRLDRRIEGLAQSLGFVYTRYADDLTFSARADRAGSVNVGKLLRAVKDIVEHEGFNVHPDKTRVMRRGRRQEVTGVVVNDRMGAPRAMLRKFRATLYQIEKDGPMGKKWGNGGDLLAAIHGYACFVAQVDADKGKALMAQVDRIFNKYGKPRRPGGGGGKGPGGGGGKTPDAARPATGATTQKPAEPAPEAPKKKPAWKLF
ncbi:MAG: RNA-directed DNA polymerase [Myxococcales bacterium]|nr:RNA-directed DNA polymerase [Myxococcales bacterium]